MVFVLGYWVYLILKRPTGVPWLAQHCQLHISQANAMSITDKLALYVLNISS